MAFELTTQRSGRICAGCGVIAPTGEALWLDRRSGETLCVTCGPSANEPSGPTTSDPAPSMTSVRHWCFAPGTAEALVCPPCDVSWSAATGSTCWCCGRAGVSVAELGRRAISISAPG